MKEIEEVLNEKINKLNELIKETEFIIVKYQDKDLVTELDYENLREKYIELIDSSKNLIEFNFLDFSNYETNSIELQQKLLSKYLLKQNELEKNISLIGKIKFSYIYRKFESKT